MNALLSLPTSIAHQALAPLDRRPLQAQVASTESLVQREGKLSQADAFYLDRTPFPPFYWDYRCGECRAFVISDACTWVEGKIARDGWCALWVPPENFERPFSWISRVIK